MRKLAIMAVLLFATSTASAYGNATFTGIVEYLGHNRLLCEYMTAEWATFMVVIEGGFCPNSINL